jgi:hypothetical protein
MRFINVTIPMLIAKRKGGASLLVALHTHSCSPQSRGPQGQVQRKTV